MAEANTSVKLNNSHRDTSANTGQNTLYNSIYNLQNEDIHNVTPDNERHIDALDLEYTHYTNFIKIYFHAMANVEHKRILIKWIHLLNSPLMSSKGKREKRNRALFVLCVSITRNDVGGTIFVAPPTSSDFEVKINVEKLARPNWETIMFWSDEYNTARDLGILLPNTCLMHGNTANCDTTRNPSLEIALDDQFKLLLFIVKDSARSLKKPHDRILVANWVQMMCCIDSKACVKAKGVRNDYMMLLSGYLHYELLMGPFTTPPARPIQPILRTIKFNSRNKIPITDPTNPRVSEFLKDLPIPTEGAFAFMALTGEMFEFH